MRLAAQLILELSPLMVLHSAISLLQTVALLLTGMLVWCWNAPSSNTSNVMVTLQLRLELTPMLVSVLGFTGSTSAKLAMVLKRT